MSPEMLQYAQLGLLALLVLGVIFLSIALMRRRASAPPQASSQVATTPIIMSGGADSLAPVMNAFQSQLSETRSAVERLAAAAESNRMQDEQVRREIAQVQGEIAQVSRKLLGSSTSGQTGERVLRDALRNLPASWLIENHQVDGKRVEFAIKLPDGLILPLDSKVVSQANLDALGAAATNDQERERHERAIRDDVLKRSREVTQYLDERTTTFAAMAVPDGAYQLAGSALAEAYQRNRALVLPFSLVMPFILLTVEQHKRTSISSDDVRATYLLTQAVTHLEQATQALEGQVGNALTQLRNGTEKASREVNAAKQSLHEAQNSATATATASKNGTKVAV